MRRLGDILAIGAIAAVAALAMPFPASAAVRSGETLEGIDNQDPTPSLEPRPVASEVLQAAVSYDDATGSVQVSVTYNGPVPIVSRVVLYGPAECASDELFPVEEGDVPALDLTLEAGDPEFGEPTQVTAALTGFDGRSTAPGTVSADGATFAATVTHPAFANRDYRCVSGVGRADAFNFYFAGFAPITLTAISATRTFAASLSQRYGRAYTRAARKYTKCANLFKAEDGSQSADCWSEFGTGRTWRMEIRSATVEPHGHAVSMGLKPFVRKWTRRFRKASTSCLKSWGMEGKGVLFANTGTCAAALAFHFFRGRTFTGGTGTGSFPKVTAFPCKRKGATYTCTNGMGDAIRWTPRPE